MKDFVIFGDSTCDLDLATRQEWDIDYIPMSYIVDEQEYPASLDWESHSVKEFYDLMRDGKRVYTAQIISNVCREKFLSAIEGGKDVLYITCSSALSSSYQSACVLAGELEEAYPGAKIYCVDSLISTLGQGYLLLEAARQRKAECEYGLLSRGSGRPAPCRSGEGIQRLLRQPVRCQAHSHLRPPGQ